jgi:hypothetical protein
MSGQKCPVWATGHLPKSVPSVPSVPWVSRGYFPVFMRVSRVSRGCPVKNGEVSRALRSKRAGHGTVRDLVSQ